MKLTAKSAVGQFHVWVGSPGAKIVRVMKLTAIIIMAVCLQTSANGLAQNTITFSGRDVNLESVFTAIKKQTSYRFFFNTSIIQNASKITIEVKNAPIEQVMNLALKDQSLTFTIKGRTIFVMKKEKEEPRVSFIETLNPIDVKGRVVNEKGDPVEGVTVTVKGHSSKTITDRNGEFSLATVDKDAVLVFTHVSMETFELKVSGKTELAINLKTKVSALGDVTITVNTGYQQIPKERATGSFGVVSNEQLNRQVGTDILSRIDGVAGSVYFDRRGVSPTDKPSPENITIRGLSTLTATKSPLIIVNNFPYDGDVSNINPNDVDNITILKDAAAASIWGARAGNGVIVITTKKGQFNQRPKVTVNTNINITEKPDLFTYPAMTASDYIDMEKYLFDQGLYDFDLIDPYYPALSPVVEILGNAKSGLITQAEADAQIDLLRNNDLRNDYSKYVYRQSIDQQYSLSLSGGSDKIRYSLSGGFDKDLESLKGNEETRKTFRLDNTFIPFRNLTIQTGLAFSNSNRKFNSIGDFGNSTLNYYYQSKSIYPYAQFADANGTAIELPHYYRMGYIDTAGEGKLLDWEYRPLDELKNADNDFKSNDLTANIAGTFNILSGLDLEANYQYEQTNIVTNKNYSTNTFFTRDLINSFSQIQDGSIKYIIPNSGILDKSTSTLSSHTGRLQIVYNHRWLKHQLNLLSGGEVREKISTTDTRRFYGYDNKTLSFASLDYISLFPQYGDRGVSPIIDFSGLSKLTDHLVSAYANAAYTFNGRYMLSGSFRRDASNLFGVNANNKWKPFWTIGASWTMSEESFYKLRTVSYLRLRTTYGYQGNVNNSLSPYPILSYNSGSATVTNQPYATISVPANPNLSWETVRQSNLGVDFRTFRDRINGTIELYRKQADKLILGSSLDPTTGLNGVTRNSANLQTEGVDITFSGVVIQKPFQWRSEFSFSLVKTKVTDYLINDKTRTLRNFETSGLSLLAVKGKSPYAIYSFPFAGLDPATGNPMGYLGKTESSSYMAILNQLRDTSDLIYNGSAVPTKFGFFNNTFSYKGFSVLVSIIYQMGYYFRKNTISYYNLYNFGTTNVDFEKRWKQPGDEKITTVPSMIYPVNSPYRDEFYAYSSANVLRADHIRLQNIRLSYDIPNKLLNGIGIRDVQFYGVINNIGIIWRANKEGLDPAYNAGNGYFPPPKNVALGLKLSL